MYSIREFVSSVRGHTEGRQGLSLGLVTGVLAGAAALFGSSDRAEADCPSPWCDTSRECNDCNPTCHHDRVYYAGVSCWVQYDPCACT